MAALADRRRILGPVDTYPIIKDEQSSLNLSESTRDRKPTELRPVFMKTGLVVNASGSSFLECGGIQLQCTVHGPRPIRGSFTSKASFNVEVKLILIGGSKGDAEPLPISQVEGPTSGIRPNGTSVLERGLANFVQTSLLPAILLDRYPKSTIDVFISIIGRGENLHSLYAAGVNAACTALINADIALRDVVTAGAITFPQDENVAYADPEYPLKKGDLGAAVSYMTAKNEEIVGMVIDGGILSTSQLDTCLSGTLEAAKTVRSLVNRLLITEFREKEQALREAVQDQQKASDIMHVDS